MRARTSRTTPTAVSAALVFGALQELTSGGTAVVATNLAYPIGDGERIAQSAPALAALAGIAGLIRSSHERWDGTGYPDRLAGSAIPLGAQIVFVCDAYAAMTSDRCYKLAMSPVEANAELERNAGTQFAPAVVEAFLAAQLAARAAPAVAVA